MFSIRFLLLLINEANIELCPPPPFIKVKEVTPTKIAIRATVARFYKGVECIMEILLNRFLKLLSSMSERREGRLNHTI